MIDTERPAAELTEASFSRWQPYPDYRDSGVDWLGDIPAHWKVKRLKMTVTLCQNGIWGDEPLGDDSNITCIRVADFDRVTFRIPSDIEFTQRSIPDRQLKSRLLKPGDLLLEKSGGGEIQPVGVVVLFDLDIPAVCSNFIARLEVADGYSSRFLCYIHAALYSARINTLSIKQSTGIQNLDSTSYLNEKVGIPSLPEQHAIAGFLDHETADIDALITKKRALIDLLHEQRSALISHAVTKGLNSDAPMKDSGIAWLGDIPAHWNLKRLDFLATVKARLGWKGLKASEYVQEGFIFLSTPNIKGEEIDFENVDYISAERYYESPEIMLENADVLLAKDGSTLGITSVVRHLPAPATVNSSIAVIRPKPDLNGIFLYRYLMGDYIQSVIQLFRDGMGVPHLFQKDIRKFQILVPPLSEQGEIAAFLDCEIAKIDALISKNEETIIRLQEYRIALISAAVTGKIDVRGEV